MKTKASVIFSLVLAFFLLGILFPEQMWGIHGISFMPKWSPFMLMGSGIGSILYFTFSNSGSTKGNLGRWVLAPISLIVGWLAFQFPIVLDSFGDAKAIIDELDIRIVDWTPRILTELFSFNIIHPKVGEQTLYALTSLGSYLTGLSSLRFLYWTEAVCASIYVLAIGSIIWQAVESAAWRIALLMMCISGPFMLVFQSHAELYALSITTSTCYLALAYWNHIKPSRPKVMLLLLCFPLVVKFHIINWLLLPVPILAIASALSQGNFVSRLFTSSKAGKLIIPAGILATGAVYLLVLGGYEGTREYTEHDLYSSLLLPIIATEGPPYDRYGLLHSAHFRDLFNQLLYWSPVALGVLALGIRSLWKSENRFALALTLSITAMILALFIVNPLLGMPLDADLFSVPVPVFLVLAILVGGRLEQHQNLWKLPIVLSALSLLSATSSVSVANASMLSQRYETLGRYMFKTHWIGSSTEIENALKLETDPNRQADRKAKILQDLRPFAVPGKDMEFAELHRTFGRYYRDTVGDLEMAIKQFNEAFAMDPILRKNVYDLVITNFMLNRHDSAFKHVEMLTRMQYPSNRKALRVAIHVSLTAFEFRSASEFCARYLDQIPGDPTILKADSLLRTGNGNAALALFRSS